MSETENITVTVSSDEYTAYMTVNSVSSLKLSLTQLGPVLKQHGVVFGIKKDALMKLVDQYNKGIPIENAIIAEGVRPFPGVRPEIDYKFNPSFSPHETQGGKTDYHEISKFISITKDQLLVVKKKFQKPVDGVTVTGKQTLFEKFDDIPITAGENVLQEEKDNIIYFKATSDGVLNYSDHRVSVFPKLEIPEDVDFSVGNIHFKGNVKVGRDVLPDFIIEAAGEIVLWGSAIACTLKAGKGIDVHAGIVGKNKGEIYSGSFIKTTFVENSNMTAKSDITVKTGIIGSHVNCEGSLKMELPRSRIVGSTIHAAKGIIAYNVGSPFDSSTTLVTGFNPEQEENHLKVKDKLDHKMKEAKDLEAKYGRPILERHKEPPAFSLRAKEDIARWDALKHEIQLTFEELKKAEEEMYDINAVIQIKETLFPRVTLQVGKGTIVTSQEFSGVTVRYSIEEEQVVIR